MVRTEATLSADGDTDAIPVNCASNLPVSVGVNVHSGVTASVTVQFTLQDPQKVVAADLIWFDVDNMSALTASASAYMLFPVTAVRMTGTTDGDVDLLVLQGDH